MRRPLIAGNWKMNKTLEESKEFVNQLKGVLHDENEVEILVFPTFVALPAVATALKGSNIKFGAQNLHFEDKGAFTGEVSPLSLKEIGCEYVIIGHSERRHIFKEDNDLISKKVKAALKHGLKPVLCVGETLTKRSEGMTQEIIKEQVSTALAGFCASDLLHVVIAYEPVWAIGTGRNARKEDAVDAIDFIRKLLANMYGEDFAKQVRILYGGSVKPGNIKEYMEADTIDGALVGGASLDVSSFYKIVKFKNI